MSAERPMRREIAERHRREHVRDARDQRWFWVRVALACWLWAAIGLVCGAYAFHTTDVDLGHVFLYAGEIITLVGVLGTLGWALNESERRGWR